MTLSFQTTEREDLPGGVERTLRKLLARHREADSFRHCGGEMAEPAKRRRNHWLEAARAVERWTVNGREP
jgi:hypothetical protein